MTCGCWSRADVALPEVVEQAPVDRTPTLLGQEKKGKPTHLQKTIKKSLSLNACDSIRSVPTGTGLISSKVVSSTSLPTLEELQQAVPDEHSGVAHHLGESEMTGDSELTGLKVETDGQQRRRKARAWTGTADTHAWTTGIDTVFMGAAYQVPPIGGCVDLRHNAHSEWLLPPEVVLFEPTKNEIFPNLERAKQQSHAVGRYIFLNTPLLQHEVEALQKLRSKMPQGEFPAYIGLNALRMLHVNKFDQRKTLDMMKVMLEKRVQYLPVSEADVLKDLTNGFMYWHGRDHMCRPCLVIRLARMGELANDKERAVRLTLFVLEYALRFSMVPGRVENWCVILDLQNVLNVISLFHIGGLVSTAQALATALEKVYCGRMAWMKIVNMPGNAVLTRAVNAAIPAEKKHKVQFPTSSEIESGSLLDFFEANQLERCYGGAAPNLAPEETYPFHFFPGATKSPVAPAERSLHENCPLELHLGSLWDTSSEISKTWIPQALQASLTPDSAKALAALSSCRVHPCRDMAHWHEICTKMKIGSRKSMAAIVRETSSSRGWLSALLPWLQRSNQRKSEDDDINRRKSAF